jgi:hypothetical protein
VAAFLASPVLFFLSEVAVAAAATFVAAMAVGLLVWLLIPNRDNDQSYEAPYVPKRLRPPSQFIQWLKSSTDRLLLDPIAPLIGSIHVSSTRAS